MQLNATLRTIEELREEDFETIGKGLREISFTDSETGSEEQDSDDSSVVCVASRTHKKRKMIEQEAAATQTEGTGFKEDSDTEPPTTEEAIHSHVLSAQGTARGLVEQFTRSFETNIETIVRGRE